MNEPVSTTKAEAQIVQESSDLQPDQQRDDEPDSAIRKHGLGSKQKSGLLKRMLGFGKKDATKIREDLADVLAESGPENEGFTLEEKTMLNNVLRLQHIRVEDVMTPRAELEAIDIDTGLGELLCAFEETGHSRLPVYAESLDDPRGMIHIRDVVSFITSTARLEKDEADKSRRSFPANLDLRKVSLAKPLSELNLLRDILFVPPSMFVSDLMEKMQAAHIQIALVIDEYGGTDGLVSLEDLIEVIVGEIEDEHDVDDSDMIVESSPGIFLCDARAELEDIALRVGDDFQTGEFDEDVETIGGLIFSVIGRVPVRGEVIEALGFEFRVIDADPRRIKKVELERSRKRKHAKT